MIKINFLGSYKSIINNFFFLALIRASNILTKLLLLIYLVRIFGEKTFGVLTWSDSILQYFIIFINFGFNVYAAKYIVKYKNNKELIDNIISSVLIIKLILFLLSFFILFSLTVIEEVTLNFYIIFLLLVSGFGDVLYPVWYFQGRENLKPLVFVVIPIKILLVFSTYFFVKSHNDLNLFIGIFVTSQILLGLFSFALLIKHSKFKFVVPKRKMLRNIFRKASLYFIGNISSVLFNATTIFLIGIFVSMESVSGFDVALKIVLVLLIPFDVLQMAALPFLAKNKNKKVLKNLIYISIASGIFIFLFLNLFPDTLMTIFGGASMIKYSYILNTLSFITLVVPLSFILGQCGLIAFGFDKEYNFSLIIASIIYILFIVIMIATNNLDFYKLLLARVFSDVILVLIRVFYFFERRILIG